MVADRHAPRRQRLLQALKAHGAEAMLVTDETNVTWLTGFTGDSTNLLVGKKVCVLISDSRYTIQLSDECPGLEAMIRDRTLPLATAAAQVVGERQVSKLAIEADSLTLAQFETYRHALKTTDFIRTSSLIHNLRAVKDAREIEDTREAIRIAERGFAALRATLRGDQTEREVAHDLEHTMRRLGARGVSFPPIIAAGARAALPHARAGQTRIGSADLLLVDWGAEGSTGYRSDLTRVLVTGKLSPKLERVYEVVLKAQLAGIAAIGPGTRCCDVDAAARKVIEDAGFGRHFGHGLGHGIGLDIHEQPRFAGKIETVLVPGMIVTVEPGIYLEGWGGVRIEDDVLVTKDGREILSSVPKSLADAHCPLN